MVPLMNTEIVYHGTATQSSRNVDNKLAMIR